MMSDLSVRCTGHFSPTSSSRARCSAVRAPSDRDLVEPCEASYSNRSNVLSRRRACKIQWHREYETQPARYPRRRETAQPRQVTPRGLAYHTAETREKRVE